MTAYLSLAEKHVNVMVCPTDEIYGMEIIGDMRVTVRPGETFEGLTYDELRELGPGAHEFPPPDSPATGPTPDGVVH